VHKHEHENADDQQRRQQPEQTLDDVLEHRSTGSALASRPRKMIVVATHGQASPMSGRDETVQGFRSISLKLNDASGMT
jgi:hypothetical protein